MIITTIIYGLTFFISIFLLYIYEKNNKVNSKLINILLIIGGILPLIFLSTVRYKVGIDYDTYIKHYIQIREWFDFELLFEFYSREPLYVLTTYIGGLLDFFKNGTGIFFVYASIFVGCTFKGILNFKDKISIPLSIFIFCTTYYLVSYNTARQMIAVAIIFWNFKNIWEKKPIKYIIFTIIAGMFHKTAYVMLFLYLLSLKVESKKINKAFYILIALSPIFMYPLYQVLVFIANNYGFYKHYTNMTAEVDLKFLLYVIPTLIMITLHRKEILKIDSRNEILYRILYLQIPAQFLGCYIPYADRIAVYFGFFQIIAMPLILKKDFVKTEKDKNISDLTKQNYFTSIYNKYNTKDNWKFIIILWYIFYFIVMYIILNSNGVYPYQTILNKNIILY